MYGYLEWLETHNTQTDIQTDSERFIYIMLPNLVSYPYLSSINSQASDETQKVMMGFLQKNKFQIFPYAYTTYDNYLNNMVVNLNPASDKSVDEHLLNTRLLSEYWRFHNLKKEYIYLKNNELYNLFKKKHFQISAYKSRDFDMCHVNHKYNVPQYTLQEELENVYVNKDHVVKAKKLTGYNEDYYLISFTNGGTLVVDDSDFNSLK